MRLPQSYLGGDPRMVRSRAIVAGLLLAGLSSANPASAADGHCAGTIYVANTPDATVSVIDISTDRVIATVPVGKGPAMPIFTRDGKRAYVNNSVDGTISQIDVVTHRVNRTIGLPKGITGSGFAISPDGNRAVLTKLGEPGFAVIVDLHTGNASRPITVGINSERVAITPDGKRAYVADGNPKGTAGTITVIDLDSATAVKTIPVGKFPFNLLVAPDGKTVYVANVLGSSISMIDTATDMVTGTIPTVAFPNGLAFAPNARAIYITSFTTGSMQVLDLDSHKVSAPIRTSASPSYLALSPDGRQAYYVHPLGNTVSVVDTATFGLAGTITVGKQPTALAACPFPASARTVAAAPPPKAEAMTGPRRLSAESTSIAELMSNAQTRAVLEKHIPKIVGDPLIRAGSGLSLGQIRDMRSEFIDATTIQAIDADLAKLSPL